MAPSGPVRTVIRLSKYITTFQLFVLSVSKHATFQLSTQQSDNSTADNVTTGQQVGRQPPTSRFQRPCNNPTTAQRTTRQQLLIFQPPTSYFLLPTSHLQPPASRIRQQDNSTTASAAVN